MPLEPIIGLEIHVQLTTKSKMFCSCANIFGDVEPNSAICPICMGYPGTLPVPNATAIEWTRRAGAALQCELALKSKFDRKSYFYPDLPKGYQISQFDEPFCRHGALTISTPEGDKTIGITRIHLEEDAAKNTHPTGANYTLIDFNRAGTPLMEIVTEPDIRAPEDAKIFLQDLQRIIRSLGVSDADMEKGQMRCDANISLREVGTDKLNPKIEVKNINSFRNVERALKYEIKRQTSEWEKGNVPHHATRGWDADTQKTVEQRVKEEAADYRYFPDPDIPPFEFTAEENTLVAKSIPELPPQKRARFVREYALTAEQAQLLIDLPLLADFFENVTSELEDLDQERVDVLPKGVKSLAQLALNMMVRQLRDVIEKQELTAETLKISPENFAELVVLVQQQKINKNAVPQVLDEMQRTGGDPDAIIQNLGLEQVSGEADLERYVKDVIAANPDVVEKIKAGKDAALQFLMGQVMAKSRGKGNPKVIIDLLKKNIMA